jgi:type I site-specific restriction endonuclease
LNDSRRLLFLDVDRLKLLDSADGRVRDLGPAGSVFDLQRIAITPDNRRIYFSTLRIDSDIWMAQLR